MASRSRGSSVPFTWSAIFYLFLVFVAPLALVNQASAQDDDQVPLKDKEDLGTVIGIDLGTTYSYVSGPCPNPRALCNFADHAIAVWV